MCRICVSSVAVCNVRVAQRSIVHSSRGADGVVLCFFFFQAEDGIRDRLVTGVQTCALPILGGQKRRFFNEMGPRGSFFGSD